MDKRCLLPPNGAEEDVIHNRETSGTFKAMRKARSMRIADVVFIVGHDGSQRFLAHRLLLSMKSLVFLDMFYGNKPVKDKEIRFPDVSPVGFKSMMNFFYDENYKIHSIQEAVETFVVARKFKVPSLEEICESYVEADTPLSPDSVCVLYDLAKTAEMYSTMHACLKMIDRRTKVVLSSECFKNASARVVLDIVKRPFLTIASEGDLLSALTRWANAECRRQGLDNHRENVEGVLQPFLPYIRWNEISLAQLRALNLSTVEDEKAFSSEDDDGDPLYSTVGRTLDSSVFLHPRAPSPYYSYRLRHTELSQCKPFRESQSFILEISVTLGSAYICGASLWLKPVRLDTPTSLNIQMVAENPSTGHSRKTSSHFLNTSLLAVLVFDKPLFVKASQRVTLVATVLSAKNLLTYAHSGHPESVELEELTMSAMPRSSTTRKKMCIFKELMIYL